MILLNWIKTKLLKVRFLAVVIGIVIFVIGCQGNPENQETTWQKIQRVGVVRVGYANENPYAYLDRQSKRLTGEAPEILRVVFQQMGIEKVEGVLTEFSSLIPGLKAKRFDVIAAGMYITPQRCAEIAFTNPTYKVGEAFLVKKGNPLKLNSYEDVASNSNARLGVVAGAIELDYALAVGIPNERIAILPDAPSAVAAVQSGRIDAYGGTSLTIQNMLDKAGVGKLERAKPFTNPKIDGKTVIGYGAFGVRKQDQELLDIFNQKLKTFIGSPEHLELVAPFGFTETELPEEVTATELCQK